MRWAVIGHSGTEGDPAVEGTPWPRLLAGLLTEQLKEPVEVESFRFWPAGPTAAGYAVDRVDELAPDGVVLVVNAFPSVVTLVSESVRRRLGQRAASAYLWFERRFEGGAPGEVKPGRPVAQRIARTILGAAAHVEVDDSARVFEEVLRRLVQREHIETVVLSESSFGPRIRALQPAIDEAVAHLQGPARVLAAAHRIPWVDATNFARNDTDEAWAADHIHLSRRGNELYAQGLAAAIVARRARV